MSKNDMKNHICTLSKNDLKDLVKTYHIPLDVHPRLPDHGFTMDHLPGGAIGIYTKVFLVFWYDLPTAGYDQNDVERLYRVLSHTTAPAAKGAMIMLPTLDEIVASLPDPRLAKKSKGTSQVRVCSALDTTPELSRPSNKRKLRKRASEAGFSAPKLGQAKDVDQADLTDFCAKIKNSLERDEGNSTRATSPLPASWDLLDSLVRSALACDVEYDQIPEDDFGTANRGEEIDLTLFPLTRGPYQTNSNVCGKALDWTITPTELKITESLLLLDLSYCFNVLSALLVSHGAELNSGYKGLVTVRNHLWEKFDQKACYVKLFRLEVTTLDGKLDRMQKDCDALGQENRELCSQKDAASDKVKELQTEHTDARVANIGLLEELSQTDAKLSNQALVVRDLQNQLALEKAKSQGYKDVVDGLREEVARFVGSGVESLVRKLLSSDEFHVALAHIADFDKALVDFPTTPFPFLGKIVVASASTLFEVTQILPDEHIRLVTSALVAPSIANEDADQVPLEHASDDLAASI
uniref:Transposase (Putative), gypsy type n=1 Tax=Tanacetum cinerariifolium TaxID=118510 RepID=A0A6L2M1T7_TANCI|nr:hypothetical protein [Tanacetum cinerariifolium]